jgi:hypothetical protein
MTTWRDFDLNDEQSPRYQEEATAITVAFCEWKEVNP